MEYLHVPLSQSMANATAELSWFYRRCDEADVTHFLDELGLSLSGRK